MPIAPITRIRNLLAASLAAGFMAAAQGANGGDPNPYVAASLTPPEPLREFRAAWVATVKNIDWPSRPELTVAQQKAEMITLLDTAVRLNLNTILLQVRTACDALYQSSLEPWSEYLTGKMGQAPAPFYDPLAFALEEAHKRGIELHAWFNPYRARHTSAFSPISKNHISKTRPDLVKPYGTQLWLDPGHPDVQEHSLRVVLDVLTRYDIDGVHFDDYFYPYPERDGRNQPIPFPDWTTWNRYRQGGGKLTRDDWRRENVNSFIRRVATAIKQRKPWVKFGVSPFGIWRPGHPPSIRGFDAYALLYADSRKWLIDGTCDYIAPQLYWPSDRVEQSFPTLLAWWHQQNPLKRHIWPGLAHSNGSAEILSQVRQSRHPGDPGTTDGHLHWSMKSLIQNRNGVTDALKNEVYAQRALVPAYPWLSTAPVTPPVLTTTNAGDNQCHFQWRRPDGSSPRQWVVQRHYKNGWATDILGWSTTRFSLPTNQLPDAVVVRAVDRLGILSSPAGVQRK